MSSNIIGHQKQKDYLQKALSSGRLAHAYLFHGPEGVGKFTFAEQFANSLPTSLSPIFLSLEHTLVSKKDKRKDIPIEDIRELRRQFSLAPEVDKWRVAIIDQADKMSAEAANAFLKLLEEPGNQTLFILISSNKESLLPTIVSRTQTIAFSLLGEEDMKKLAVRITSDKEAGELACWFAAGRPGILVKLLFQKDILEKEKKFLKELHGILSAQDLPRAFIFSEKIAADEGERNKTIEYLLRLIRAQLLKGQIKPNPIELVSKIKKISRISSILETTNVNPRLAMDTIFLEAIK
ncbi:MAG: AAA family ATPase [bacterium]|nr:AAA family ATPase [bacterium]